MMRVIIHQKKAIALVFDFETAAGVLKPAKRGHNFLERNPEFAGERDHTERITDVMPAGNVQDRFPKFFPSPRHRKDGREIAQINIGAAIIRLFGKSERDWAGMPGTDSEGMAIVRAIKYRALGLLEQLAKNSLDRREISIKIEVLFFHVEDKRVLWFEKA